MRTRAGYRGVTEGAEFIAASSLFSSTLPGSSGPPDCSASSCSNLARIHGSLSTSFLGSVVADSLTYSHAPAARTTPMSPQSRRGGPTMLPMRQPVSIGPSCHSARFGAGLSACFEGDWSALDLAAGPAGCFGTQPAFWPEAMFASTARNKDDSARQIAAGERRIMTTTRERETIW